MNWFTYLGDKSWRFYLQYAMEARIVPSLAKNAGTFLAIYQD
jgi:hypothetical protein